MSTIDIKRPRSFFGMARPIDVSIDGKVVGEIESGKSGVFEVCPGLHTIQISMDWCKSKPLTTTLGEGDTVNISANTAFGLLAMLFCLVSPSNVFNLEKNIT